MSKIYFIIGMTCLATGCAGGQWVKEGTPHETVQRDYSECQTMGIAQEPQAGTLGNKIGANPDMSGQAFEKMHARERLSVDNGKDQWTVGEGNN